MAGFDVLKAAQRDQRKAERKAKRAQRRRERRCWWTRPYRHEYARVVREDDGMMEHKQCVSCGKPY